MATRKTINDMEYHKFNDNDEVKVEISNDGAPISPTNPLPIEEALSEDLEGGGKVAVGTTAVEVTFSGATKSVVITSDVDNTGKLFIGKSNVTNAGANSMTVLESGDSLTIDYDDDTNAVYVVSDTASQNFWKGALL